MPAPWAHLRTSMPQIPGDTFGNTVILFRQKRLLLIYDTPRKKWKYQVHSFRSTIHSRVFFSGLFSYTLITPLVPLQWLFSGPSSKRLFLFVCRLVCESVFDFSFYCTFDIQFVIIGIRTNKNQIILPFFPGNIIACLFSIIGYLKLEIPNYFLFCH